MFYIYSLSILGLKQLTFVQFLFGYSTEDIVGSYYLSGFQMYSVIELNKG